MIGRSIYSGLRFEGSGDAVLGFSRRDEMVRYGG